MLVEGYGIWLLSQEKRKRKNLGANLGSCLGSLGSHYTRFVPCRKACFQNGTPPVQTHTVCSLSFHCLSPSAVSGQDQGSSSTGKGRGARLPAISIARHILKLLADLHGQGPPAARGSQCLCWICLECGTRSRNVALGI